MRTPILTVPFTPIHLALPIFLYGMYSLIKLRIDIDIDLMAWLTITAGSIIPDVQGIFYLITGIGSLHGFSHTIVGAFVYSLIYGIGLVIIDRLKILNLKIKPVKNQILIIFFSIIFLHLVPDMFIYPEMQIFWPVLDSSFGVYSNMSSVVGILLDLFLAGLIMLFLAYIVENIKPANKSK